MRPLDAPETFLVGANLPWVHYGIDFGANAWCPRGGVAQPGPLAELEAAFERLAGSGVKAVRWFLFCDGRAGIEFGPSGRPHGLDGSVCHDIDAALAAARRYGLRIMFVLLDFGWCDHARVVKGVQLGGRSHLLRDPEDRQALLENVLRPVLMQYGSDPTILAWDIINEPEWIRTLTSAERRDFLHESVQLVHAHTNHPVTVGSAGARWRASYQDLGLDFYQVHWYDALRGQPPLHTPVSALGFDRPVVLGEFPTLGSGRKAREILNVARGAGYAGAFYWSALAQDQFSNSDAGTDAVARCVEDVRREADI